MNAPNGPGQVCRSDKATEEEAAFSDVGLGTHTRGRPFSFGGKDERLMLTPRRLFALLSAAVVIACGPVPPPKPPVPRPPQTITFDVVACGAPLVEGRCLQSAAGATITVDDKPPHVQTANADGYTLFTVPAGLGDTFLTIDQPGYRHYDSGTIHPRDLATQHNLIALTPAAPPHVDPSIFSLAELAAIRGAMWPTGMACSPPLSLPFGPRPSQPTNIIATDFFSGYTPEDQAATLRCLRSAGYTHVVAGPIVDSDGYHGQYTPRDWRGAAFEQFLDVLQTFWDAGLAPVVFIHPDGWTFEQTRELTPFFTTPRAQRLMRIVVPHGWEPCRYECSSYTWAAYGQWARETWPTALVLLHTVSDIDAPVGTDARGDDNGHPNAEGWARVVPFFHGWLTQSNAFETPDAHGDPGHPDRTNFQNWAAQFDPAERGSYRDRFEHGYAGWPTGSAWGLNHPLLVYAGEYSAYWRYWRDRPEAEALNWGDAAVRAGAAGYMDGGTVAVQVRR